MGRMTTVHVYLFLHIAGAFLLMAATGATGVMAGRAATLDKVALASRARTPRSVP